MSSPHPDDSLETRILPPNPVNAFSVTTGALPSKIIKDKELQESTNSFLIVVMFGGIVRDTMLVQP